MLLDDRMTIDAAPAEVWKLFQDPRRVAECMPGAQFHEQLADGSYRGSMQAKFGPKVVTFGGTAVYVADHDSRTGDLRATGQDRRGSSRAALTLSFTLRSADGSGTVVAVSGNARFSGPLSQFAEAGGVHVAKVLMQDFAEAVAHTLSPAAQPSSAVDPAVPQTGEATTSVRGPVGSATASAASRSAPSRPAASSVSMLTLVGRIVRARTAAIGRRLWRGRRER